MQNFDQKSQTIHILTNVSESRSIASLKIYNQSDQSGSNSCDQSPCQHLCFPKPHNDYTCRCTLGYLLENETECKEDTKNDKVISKEMFHSAQEILRSCSCTQCADEQSNRSRTQRQDFCRVTKHGLEILNLKS